MAYSSNPVSRPHGAFSVGDWFRHGAAFHRREFVEDGAADDAGLGHGLARRVEHLVGREASQFRHGEQFAEDFDQVVDVAFGKSFLGSWLYFVVHVDLLLLCRKKSRLRQPC